MKSKSEGLLICVSSPSAGGKGGKGRRSHSASLPPAGGVAPPFMRLSNAASAAF